jgi:hypothetical protein
MTFTFRPAVRENVPLLIGLAGGTGSGKTYSALQLARGLAAKRKIALIDTESGRGLHYADEFKFDHAPLSAPFRPDAYLEAILAAEEAGYPVVIVDSASHEYAGEGGILDWHDEELDRLAGDDWKAREARTFAAWVLPKQAHKRFVNKLLQLHCHLILCFRAEEKIEIVKENGKTVVRPKKLLSGFEGWVPITEKNLPYELTISFLLTADTPGVPKPIKLQSQHRPFFPPDEPIKPEMGYALGQWAKGSGPEPKAGQASAPQPASPDAPARESASGPDTPVAA